MRILIVVIAFISLIGCSKQNSKESTPTPAQQQAPAAQQQQTPIPSVAPSHSTPAAPESQQQAATEGQTNQSGKASVAGIEWEVPNGWKTQEPRPMRVVTYSIPAAGGGENGECGVFYFGTGQGGDAASNIERWKSQFEMDSKPQESSTSKGDLKITTVQASGAYLAPGGPMMQSTGKKSNYRLHGVIVEGPQGSIFFKITGPSAAIKAAEKDIAKLIDSIKKQTI